MDIFEQAYLNILSEENYSNEQWMKYKSYKGIDFYIRKDGHLQNRLNERYENKINLTNIINFVKVFIKEDFKNNGKISKKADSTNPEIPFTVYAELSNVYISGRFKANNGTWRCYIATALPNEDTHHSSNDYFKSMKI